MQAFLHKNTGDFNEAGYTHRNFYPPVLGASGRRAAGPGCGTLSRSTAPSPRICPCKSCGLSAPIALLPLFPNSAFLWALAVLSARQNTLIACHIAASCAAHGLIKSRGTRPYAIVCVYPACRPFARLPCPRLYPQKRRLNLVENIQNINYSKHIWTITN
jgi:hypothetical protein